MGFHQRRTDRDLGALAAVAEADFTFVSRARRQLNCLGSPCAQYRDQLQLQSVHEIVVWRSPYRPKAQGNVPCIEARSIDACMQLLLRSGAVALHRRF